MNKLIRDIEFTENKISNEFIINALQSIGIMYLDDLETIEHYVILRPYGMGIKKMMAVQEVMKENNIQFKDKYFLKTKFDVNHKGFIADR